MNFSALTSPLIALTRSGLTGAPVSEGERSALNDVRWDDLCELAQAHDLLPLVGAGLLASRLQPPAGVAARLTKAGRVSEMRADMAWGQLSPIITAFHAAGVGLMVLKGAQLAVRYYATPGLRPFGDLDLLVAEKDRERAAEVLVGLGYRNADDQGEGGKAWCVENHFHWNFVRDRAFGVELHWDLTFPASTMPIDAKSIWADSVTVCCEGGAYRVCGLCDELIFLAAHIARHCFRLPLRNHVDIAAILGRSPELDWETLWRRAGFLRLQEDLLAVLGTTAGLGLIRLPDAMARRVQAAASSRFDLPFLVRYAVEAPFVSAPERWLDVESAGSLPERIGRLWKALFPKYTHLWTPGVEHQAAGSPVRVYALAWGRRAVRVSRRAMDLPRFVHDLRVTRRVHRMFGGRRRQGASPH